MLSRSERSERVPSIETLARVYTGLQITLAAFFDDSGAPLPQVQDAGPDLSSLEPRAREHFQDAIRSIQRGMEAAALPNGGGQRRRKRHVWPTPR
jgi:transcriptional regulator with XRE-family HTH domain